MIWRNGGRCAADGYNPNLRRFRSVLPLSTAVFATPESAMELSGLLDGLAGAAGWVIEHAQLVAGALVALIIVAFLASGRGSN